MANELKLDCLARTDRDGQQYFFTRPNLPVSVDLAQCVIFVRPWTSDTGSGAEITIKPYTGKQRKEDENEIDDREPR